MEDKPIPENFADATENDQVHLLEPSILPEDDEANSKHLPQEPDSIPEFDEDGREDT